MHGMYTRKKPGAHNRQRPADKKGDTSVGVPALHLSPFG